MYVYTIVHFSAGVSTTKNMLNNTTTQQQQQTQQKKTRRSYSIPISFFFSRFFEMGVSLESPIIIVLASDQNIRFMGI